MMRVSPLIRAIARPISARTFSSTSNVNKDLIQDLYIKELKAYKPSGKQDFGTVKAFSTPTPPTAPSLLDSAALASELEAYDADVIVAAPATSSSSAHHHEASEGVLGADEYLKLVESDVKHEAAH